MSEVIALDEAAIVEHENGALAQGLRLGRSVRQCRKFVDVETGFAFESDAMVGGGDERMHIGGGHARA